MRYRGTPGGAACGARYSSAKRSDSASSMASKAEAYGYTGVEIIPQPQPAAYSGQVAVIGFPVCITPHTRSLPKRLSNRKLMPCHTYTSSFTRTGSISSR
jgi:hypothetical protein